MPIYIYRNPVTEDLIEIFQSMNEDHVYIDEDGLEWKREFTTSQLNTVGSFDPWSSNDFVSKSSEKDTVGDRMDRSAELSEKRADQNGGVDPIKQKYFKEYSKKRGGSKHPKDKPKTIETNNWKIEL